MPQEQPQIVAANCTCDHSKLQQQIERLLHENSKLRKENTELQTSIDKLMNALADLKYLMSREKLHPDRVERDIHTYDSRMAEIARYYALTSKVVAAMADLTELRRDGDNYVIAWFDGSDVRMHYVSDVEKFSAREIYQDPDFFFLNGMSGDCEDFAIAMAALLAKKGYNVSLCVGYTNDAVKTKSVQHAWLEVEINGSIYYGEYYGYKYVLFAEPIAKYYAIECFEV
jgi:regulator of replication initiation timing